MKLELLFFRFRTSLMLINLNELPRADKISLRANFYYLPSNFSRQFYIDRFVHSNMLWERCFSRKRLDNCMSLHVIAREALGNNFFFADQCPLMPRQVQV